jgi:hypothetical protein
MQRAGEIVGETRKLAMWRWGVWSASDPKVGSNLLVMIFSTVAER